MTLGIMYTPRTNFQPLGFWYRMKATSAPMPTCSVAAMRDHRPRFCRDLPKLDILKSFL